MKGIQRKFIGSALLVNLTTCESVTLAQNTIVYLIDLINSIDEKEPLDNLQNSIFGKLYKNMVRTLREKRKADLLQGEDEMEMDNEECSALDRTSLMFSVSQHIENEAGNGFEEDDEEEEAITKSFAFSLLHELICTLIERFPSDTMLQFYIVYLNLILPRGLIRAMIICQSLSRKKLSIYESLSLERYPIDKQGEEAGRRKVLRCTGGKAVLERSSECQEYQRL